MTKPSAIQLIETMRVAPGRQIPLLHGHMQRLRASCLALDYTFPDALNNALQAYVASLDANQTHRLRLLLDRDGSHTFTSGLLPDTPQPVQLAVHTSPLQADIGWLQHKTTHRPWYDAMQNWLSANPDFFDVVFCNEQDQVCEASRSNVYIQDESGRWLTPPLSCGLLPGVQRQNLLDQGLVTEAAISRNDLLHAPAIRVSNALRGWLDAVIGQPAPGSHLP